MVAKIAMLEEEVTNKYKEGMLIRELAEEYNVCWLTVQKYLAKWGVKRRKVGFANITAWRKRTPDYQQGAKNPAWKNGMSKSTVNRRVRAVLDEAGVDQYTCAECGKQNKVRHNIHHRDGDRSNNAVENLEVLCSRCHNSGWEGARHVRKRDTKTGRFV